MSTEKAIDDFIENNSDSRWLDHSDGYQLLFEACGDNLLPGLLRLTKHPSPEIRAAVVSLLATRRPHTPEMMEAIAPLINDPHPLVRIRALTHLQDFGELAATVVPDVYALVVAEKLFPDQAPRVTAISFLLEHDRPTWEFLVDELVDVVMADGGDMAEFVALRTLIDLGVVSFEGKSEEVDRDKLEG
jgi:hypothetical protein